MDGWLKWLVAITCLAVLGAIGWWIWSDRQEAIAAEVAARRAAIATEVAAQADLDRRRARQVEECRDDLAAWDRGDRAAVLEKYNPRVVTALDNCRALVGGSAND